MWWLVIGVVVGVNLWARSSYGFGEGSKAFDNLLGEKKK